jgi:hypothetical protein
MRSTFGIDSHREGLIISGFNRRLIHKMHNIKTLFTVLAALALAHVCSASSLVTNGDFETGDFSGWTCPTATCSGTSGDPYWMNVTSAFPSSGANSAHIGTFFDDNGDPLTGYISQMLVTTPGAEYTVSFSYGEYNPNPTQCAGDCYLDAANINTTDTSNPYYQGNSLALIWDGNTSFSDSSFFTMDQGIFGQGQGFYKTVSMTLTATGATTLLQFNARDLQADVVLDNISVTSNSAAAAATPEPSTLGLLGAAMVAMGLLARKRAARQNS